MKKIKIGLVSFLIYLALLIVLVLSERNVEGASINNLFDALWYSLVTLSTVGYGDYYPVTTIGKTIGLVFVFSSLGVLGYLISQLTVKLTQYMEDKKNGLFGTKMKNHIVLIGYNKFSNTILQQIIATGINVAVVTDKKEDVDVIADNYEKHSVFTLLTDYNNFDNLEKVNISKASKVFINFNNDTEMLVYILDMKNHYSNLEIIVSLNNTNFQNTFQSAGVLYALSREEIASKLVASYIFEPDVASFTEDLMASAKRTEDFDMIELRVSPENPYFEKNYDFAFTDIRSSYSSVLLGIYKNNKLYKNPTEPITILENDYLIIMTNGNNSSKLKEDFGVEEGRF
mgnify:FL=1